MTNGRNGLILKAPYSTNKSYPFYSPNDKEEVLLRLSQIYENIFATQSSRVTKIPYYMLQPRMGNTFEYKVVCWNGIPAYITDRKGKGCAFAQGESSRLFNFANDAIAALKLQLPYAITEGVVRVDIFEGPHGWVVNEFESLEANYYSKIGTEEAQTSHRWKLF
jgi:hypothetical protein